MTSEARAAWNLSFYYMLTVAIAQLSRWVNPTNIAQRHCNVAQTTSFVVAMSGHITDNHLHPYILVW